MTMPKDQTESLDAYYFLVREPNSALGHRFTDSFADLSAGHLGIALADMLRLAEEHSGVNAHDVFEVMESELRRPTSNVRGQPVS